MGGRSACSWPAVPAADPLADSGLAGAARLDPDAHEHSAAGHRGAGHRPRLATRIAQLPVEQRVQATMNLVYAKPAMVPAQRVAEAQEDALLTAQNPWSGQAFQSALRGILATYFDRGPDAPWKLAERIDDPVLMIYGQQDKLVNPRLPDARRGTSCTAGSWCCRAPATSRRWSTQNWSNGPGAIVEPFA